MTDFAGARVEVVARAFYTARGYELLWHELPAVTRAWFRKQTVAALEVDAQWMKDEAK